MTHDHAGNVCSGPLLQPGCSFDAVDDVGRGGREDLVPVEVVDVAVGRVELDPGDVVELDPQLLAGVVDDEQLSAFLVDDTVDEQVRVPSGQCRRDRPATSSRVPIGKPVLLEVDVFSNGHSHS